MTGKGGDYEGWVLRMIDKPEDILFSSNDRDWIKYASDKIGLTGKRIDVLLDYRDRVYRLPDEMGFYIQEQKTYRVKGRFAKADTPGATLYRSVPVIKDIETNRTLSKSVVKNMIKKELESLKT